MHWNREKGIHLSPFNVAQIGRSSKGLDEEQTIEEAFHLSLLSPALFMDIITFIIRSHKAFSEMDQDSSGIITRAQAAQVMRSFGGWDSCRIALHVLAALFDASSSHISPEYVPAKSTTSHLRSESFSNPISLHSLTPPGLTLLCPFFCPII